MKKLVLIFCVISLLCNSELLHAQRVMEKLNRGLVAIRISPSQVFLSWRLLGYDPDNVLFNIYRDNVLVTSSPLADVTNFVDNTSTATNYTVKTLRNGIENGEQFTVAMRTASSFEIAMNVPAPMSMPDGSTCTYSPGDCSAGDADGDGEYEIIVKWDPSNAKDNSQSGYTGNVYLDVYKFNGTQLCRIDLGKNIRAGAHYTQFQVADYDGDGKAEIFCKTAPGTKSGTGNYISKGPAATATHTADYRNSGGYILSGPEYLTVFSALTGAELATAEYSPVRGTVSSWGDSYGNRVDRFLAGTAYVDGILPSAIMCRGYYTRSTIAAWNYRNGVLSRAWLYDSGTTSGVGIYGQGNHNLSIGDVDNDGKDEIIWGAGAVDHDGKFMYSTGLGHGDAMHLSDLDPDRKGLEVWDIHESTGAAYGEEMHDARTGAILWGTYTGTDNGRGLAVNVIPGNRGFEMWSAHGPGTMSKSGVTLSTTKGSMNFRIYWDGDLEDEMLDGNTISKYGVGSILNAIGCVSVNGSKSNPCLSADLFGDWREELVMRTEDNTRLRVYTTVIPTAFRRNTLMHDPVYRAGVAWQNTAYNQPPHVGYYMGDDMDPAPPAPVYNGEKRWKSGTIWDNNTTSAWVDSLNQTSVFKNGDGVVFDVSSNANATASVTGNLSPRNMIVNTTFTVDISGSGSLVGDMELWKIGAGALKLNNNNGYTGKTIVSNGDFYNNGILSASEVIVNAFVKIGGKGVFGNHVYINNLASVSPGSTINEAAKLTFLKNLQESGKASYSFDFKLLNNVVAAHDTVFISGNWILGSSTTFQLTVSGGSLPPGNYPLVKCSGVISGNLSKIKIIGVPTYLSYSLVNINGTVTLKVIPPAILTWKGTVDNKWDNAKTANWNLLGEQKIFSANDSVLFNDEASVKSITISDVVVPASVLVETSDNFSLSGAGYIDGAAIFTKKGSGKVSVSTLNKYSGKTFVNDGTLEISSIANGSVASSIGASTKLAANVVLNGGKLSYSGATTTTDRGFTIGSLGGGIGVSNSASTLSPTGIITGTGRFSKEGAGRLALSIANNYSGGTTISAGTLALTTDVANVNGLGTDTILLAGGTLEMFNSITTDNLSNWKLKVPLGYVGTLMVDGKSIITGSITGGGRLNYYTPFTENVLNSDASNFMGLINVTTDTDGGLFAINNSKGFEKAKIYLNNNVTFLYRTSANLIIPIGDLAGTSNAVLGAGGTGVSSITWQIGARNATSTFSGRITDTQYSGTGAVTSIIKVGTGTWTLNGNNTYCGGTEIHDGVIMVNNTIGSGLGSGLVNVFFDATLAGSGILTSPLKVGEGGTIDPGNGIGTLTVNNNIEMLAGSILSIDIDKSSTKNDLLKLSGQLTMNGKLLLNTSLTTAFADGDSFKIISGTVVGLPQEIVPAFPAAGLEWDLADFVANGTLKVKTATSVSDLQTKTQIFPNPVSDELHININKSYQKLRINIVNSLGSSVYFNCFENTNNIVCNIAALPRGIYFLQLHSDNESFTTKIIKK